jgi:hypothetical protein
LTLIADPAAVNGAARVGVTGGGEAAATGAAAIGVAGGGGAVTRGGAAETGAAPSSGAAIGRSSFAAEAASEAGDGGPVPGERRGGALPGRGACGGSA